MENQEQFENQTEPENPQLIVTEDMRSYIYDMSKWARFLGIVGFVVSAFLFLAALTVGPAINANPEMAKMLGQLGTMDSATITVVFCIYGAAICYPSFLMVRYASSANQGVLYGEQNNLNDAMSNLKSLFKYFGILALIFIGLNLITLIAMVIGAAA